MHNWSMHNLPHVWCQLWSTVSHEIWICVYVRQSHALNGGVSWNDWCLRVMRLKVNQQLLMTTLWVMQRHSVGNVKSAKVKYVPSPQKKKKLQLQKTTCLYTLYWFIIFSNNKNSIANGVIRCLINKNTWWLLQG